MKNNIIQIAPYLIKHKDRNRLSLENIGDNGDV